MKINDGAHKILFRQGKLYLDGVQIAGEGVLPANKEVTFDFQVGQPKPVEKNPSILEINVFDSIPARDLGPGQKK